MQNPRAPADRVADASSDNWVDRFAPEWVRPYARVARWDRPIGFWLLFWPCAFSLALATLAADFAAFDWLALVLFLLGAIAMRGAGCTFNDIVDRDIDTKVERTRLRPIASGRVSVVAAVAFMGAQALVGLLILLQFNAFTVWTGIASLGLIVAYPFMKRITWWPQAFLGIVFSWGALVGWTSQMGELGWPPLLLYLGCIAWTIGYDTIYALQDIEDDALIGVKSTARLFGDRSNLLVTACYAATLALWGSAALLAGAGIVLLVGLLLVAAHFIWQVATLDATRTGNSLARFKANHWVGVTLTLALLAEWLL